MRFFVSVVMLVVSFALFAGRASAQDVRLCADGKRSYFNVCPEDMQSRPPVVVEPPAKKSTKSKVVDCNASRAPGKRLPPECPQPSVVVEEPPVKPVDCNASRAPGKRLPPECPQPPAQQTGQSYTDPTTGMEFVWIPAGSFLMGSPAAESGRQDDEQQHSVTISQGFWLGKYEVTQGQWEKVMGENPSRFKGCGDNCPVEQVSWLDIQGFIGELNARSQNKYRLPTEAEWEYAARAGTTSAYWWGDWASHEYANYGKDECCDGLTRGRDRWQDTAPVGSFAANGFGLHDMQGNVWEWTCSEYEKVYSGREKTCNNHANYTALVVVRGGSWDNDAYRLRSSDRYGTPGARTNDIGFRAARTR